MRQAPDSGVPQAHFSTDNEGVPPLVRGQVHGPAVLVADVTALQPVV